MLRILSFDIFYKGNFTFVNYQRMSSYISVYMPAFRYKNTKCKHDCKHRNSLFIDELPCLDTSHAGFVNALGALFYSRFMLTTTIIQAMNKITMNMVSSMMK